MLGVFRMDGSKLDPNFAELPGPEYIPALEDGYLEKHFVSFFSRPVIVNLGIDGFMAYSEDEIIRTALSIDFPSSPLHSFPSPLFGANDGIFCIYRGHSEERKRCGNAVDLITAAYKDMQVRGHKTTPFMAAKYNCILYHSSVGSCGSAFVVNCLEDIPLYWGVDSEGSCIVTDDMEMMKKVCGSSFRRIPKGRGILIPVKEAASVKTHG